MKSFLLIGQSNMAGRGEFGEVPEIKNPNCFMLRNGRWVGMSEPINPDRGIFEPGFHSGVGLSASFADEYAKYFKEDIGLIPCADGGTSLSEWMPGEILYDNAVNNARLAMRTSEFSGILWHQGENDCAKKEDAYTYRERFLKMISQMKKDIGCTDIPVIIGEIGEFAKTYEGGKLKWVDVVNDTLKSMPSCLKNCAFASADGLSCKDDGIHFDSYSYRILGSRYFEAYKDMRENL